VLPFVMINGATFHHNPCESHTRENQPNRAMLMHEQTTTNARFRVTSCEDVIDGEILCFFITEPIASPAPVPAKDPTASTMRTSKVFIFFNSSSFKFR
jgi:hypothetical protein